MAAAGVPVQVLVQGARAPPPMVAWPVAAAAPVRYVSANAVPAMYQPQMPNSGSATVPTPTVYVAHAAPKADQAHQQQGALPAPPVVTVREVSAPSVQSGAASPRQQSVPQLPLHLARSPSMPAYLASPAPSPPQSARAPPTQDASPGSPPMITPRMGKQGPAAQSMSAFSKLGAPKAKEGSAVVGSALLSDAASTATGSATMVFSSRGTQSTAWGRLSSPGSVDGPVRRVIAHGRSQSLRSQSLRSQSVRSHSACSNRSGASLESDSELEAGCASDGGLGPMRRSLSARGSTSRRSRDSVAQERRHFLQAVNKERRWLRRALSTEVREAAFRERRHRYLLEEEARLEARKRHEEQRLREASERRQQLDSERFEEERRREAQERRLARRAYAKQREELRRQKEEEIRLQKVYYAKQCKEAEKRRQAQFEVAARADVQRKFAEQKGMMVQAADAAREGALEKNRAFYQQAALEAREARELRSRRVSEFANAVERERVQRIEDKMAKDREKEERLARQWAAFHEQTAEYAASVKQRRSSVHAEAGRIEEERRNSVTQQVLQKDSRFDELSLERQRLRELRRATQVEARRAFELVRHEMEKQAIASRFSPEKIQAQVDILLENTCLPPQLQREALAREQVCTSAASSSGFYKGSVGSMGSARLSSPRTSPRISPRGSARISG